MTCHLTCSGGAAIPNMALVYDEGEDELVIQFLGDPGMDTGDVDEIIFTGTLNGEPFQIAYSGPWLDGVPGQLTIEDLWDALGGIGEGDYSGINIQTASAYDYDLPEGEQFIGYWSGSIHAWDPSPPVYEFIVTMGHIEYDPDFLGADRLFVNGLQAKQWVLSNFDAVVIDTDQATGIDITATVGPTVNSDINFDDLVHDGVVDDGDALERLAFMRGGDVIAEWTGSLPFERKPKVISRTLGGIEAVGGLRLVIEGFNLDHANVVTSSLTAALPEPNRWLQATHLAYNPAGPDVALNATAYSGRGVLVNEWSDTKIDLTFGPGPDIQLRDVYLSSVGDDSVLYPYQNIGEFWGNASLITLASSPGMAITASRGYVADAGEEAYPGGDRITLGYSGDWDTIVVYAPTAIDATSRSSSNLAGTQIRIDHLVADGVLPANFAINSIVVLNDGDVVASSYPTTTHRVTYIESGAVVSSPGPGLLTIEGQNLDMVDNISTGIDDWPNIPLDPSTSIRTLAYNPSGPSSSANWNNQGTSCGTAGDSYHEILCDRGVTVLEWSPTRIRLEFGAGPAISVEGITLRNVVSGTYPPNWLRFALIGEAKELSSLTIAANDGSEVTPLIEEVIVTP